jgi:ribonuclease T1
MPHRWMIGFGVLCCLWTGVSFGSHYDGASTHISEPAAAESQITAPALEEHRSAGSRNPAEQIAPKKAYDLLATLQQRKGEPLPGYAGGRAFQNREGRLPRGRYREYDVNRKISGRSRDAERIVIEQNTGKAYYSGDHYRTFIPLN